jgi:hypothetical protein
MHVAMEIMHTISIGPSMHGCMVGPDQIREGMNRLVRDHPIYLQYSCCYRQGCMAGNKKLHLHTQRLLACVESYLVIVNHACML